MGQPLKSFLNISPLHVSLDIILACAAHSGIIVAADVSVCMEHFFLFQGVWTSNPSKGGAAFQVLPGLVWAFIGCIFTKMHRH